MSQTDSTQTSVKQHKIKSSLLSPLKDMPPQFTKTYRFYIPSQDGVQEIIIDLSIQITIQEAVKKVLQKAAQSMPVDTNQLNYEVYVPKKNGKPQQDFPSYQADITLEKTKTFSFSLAHVTYHAAQRPLRKCTADLTHYNNMTRMKQISQSPIKKQKKNWFLKILGCA